MRHKRKIVMEDSEEEANINAVAYKRGLSSRKLSPDPARRTRSSPNGIVYNHSSCSHDYAHLSWALI